MSDLISVVIPVYNRSEALKATLRSIINQTYKNIEIIVVDDGSEEDIQTLIKAINDSRLVYYRLEHTNANIARNYGILKSRGKYIAMIDSDDIWHSDHLEDSIRFITNNKVEGIYGGLYLKNRNSNNIIKVIKVRLPYSTESMIDYLLKTVYGAQTSTLFMTSESVRKIMWDPNLNRHQDYDFVIRYSKVFKFLPKDGITVDYVFSPKKNIDFKSCINMISANKKDIDPQLYNSYHLSMLKSAIQQQADKKIINHYKKHAVKYKEYITFQFYASLKDPRNVFQRIYTRISFVWRVLTIDM
ncbi:MAG: glycosyltransferase [Bacteroidales bacterium]|nr:glycosyltransferase [Bacteroidales bacterium]